MDIRYTGPLRAAVIQIGDGWARCPRDEVVDVPEDIAKGLLEQDDIWELDGPVPRPKRPTKRAGKDAWRAYVDAINADGDGIPATEDHTVDELIALADAREAELAALNPDDQEV